jgi:hypothetical protein
MLDLLPEWFCVLGLIPISALVLWLFYWPSPAKIPTRKASVKNETAKEK